MRGMLAPREPRERGDPVRDPAIKPATYRPPGKRLSRPRWLRDVVSALRWAARAGPREIVAHRRWLLQELGFRGRLWSPTYRGGRLEVDSPTFLADHSRPLDDPDVVPAAGASHMRDDDLVLGLAVEGEARAYPWWIMDDHHVANDVVGGRPVTILLCEMCGTGLAVDPVVGGRRLTFESRGVYNGTITLDDHQTGSVWSPYLATAIRGPLAGTKLTLLPLAQMEWRAWRELHPETTVLADGQGSRTGHGSRYSLTGAEPVSRRFYKTMARWDRRLPHNTLVLGVVTPGGQRAYVLEDLLEGGGVLNDRVGETDVVILAHRARGSYTALAYRREAAGRTLTFRPADDGAVDEETGSTWTFRGRAVDGPLAGESLEFIESHVSKWYVWGAHYPGIEIATRAAPGWSLVHAQ